MHTSRFRAALGVSLLSGALVALSACGDDAPEVPQAPAVRVVQVSAATPGTRSFSGTTRAAVESQVSFLVGGTVVRTLVNVGDRVQRGQLLAVLDPSDYQLQAQQARSGVSIAEAQRAQALTGVDAARSGVTQAEAGVAQAEAALAQARAGSELADAEFARIRALYAEDLVPLSVYDGVRTQAETARAAVRTAQAAVSQARAAVGAAQSGVRAAQSGVGAASAATDAARDGAGLAQRQLGYTRLTAPVSGAVARVLAEPGELVAPGQPVALVTTQGGPMEVEVSVPETVIGQITPGDAVVVRLAAFPEEPFAATVSEVGVAPGRTATAYPLVVTLARADARLRSGMAATVEIDAPADTAADGFVVPVEAVYQDAQGAYVLAVSERAADASASPGTATVTRQAVTTGDLRPGGVEIRTGLTPGVRIVATGGGEVRPGSTVRVLDRDPLSAQRRDT